MNFKGNQSNNQSNNELLHFDLIGKILGHYFWSLSIKIKNFATRNMTNSLVLLQKLCKNCPHPEKLHLTAEGGNDI